MQRGFCRVGERFVHYRWSGSGAPVVLLHQTPQSSAAMEPLMRALGGRCASIAIDTPGFGLSDPLPGATWSVAELCTALAATLDQLGVERVALCGQHTGASIATEFARRWPQRVVCLALDGYTVFNPLERETVLPHQLYRFEPRWDGAHLLWAWARFRDGWMFFPWSVRSRTTRRMTDMPSPDVIHQLQILELLRSRESHLAIYPGVFEWDGLAAAQSLAVPTLIAGTADDQLFAHLDRLHGLAPGVRIERFGNGARDELLQAQAEFVGQHLMSGAVAGWAAPTTAALDPTATGRARTYAAELAVTAENLRAAGRPLLLLHGAGGAAELELAAAGTGQDGPVLAIDLPGHGDSGARVLDAADSARSIVAALDALGVDDLAIRGRGLGAAVAAELAIDLGRRGRRVPRRRDLWELRVLDPVERARWHGQYAPAIEPRWDGGHLLSLWHQLRDRQFFLPWFERDRAHIRAVEPELDPELLTRQVFAALRCTDWALAHRHWFDWPTDSLRQVPCAVGLHAQRDDGWARDLAQLRRHVAR